jgi:hypothetical protein
MYPLLMYQHHHCSVSPKALAAEDCDCGSWIVVRSVVDAVVLAWCDDCRWKGIQLERIEIYLFFRSSNKPWRRESTFLQVSWVTTATLQTKGWRRRALLRKLFV